ncbi:MAG: helix-turn-helix domain-containing protein [Faecalibacillus sp.]
MRKNNPLRQLPITKNGYGNIKLHLDEIIKDRDVSLNQLSFRTEIQRSQLRRYRDNKIQRVDLDLLARLCYVLECDINDIIEFVPPEEY